MNALMHVGSVTGKSLLSLTNPKGKIVKYKIFVMYPNDKPPIIHLHCKLYCAQINVLVHWSVQTPPTTNPLSIYTTKQRCCVSVCRVEKASEIKHMRLKIFVSRMATLKQATQNLIYSIANVHDG